MSFRGAFASAPRAATFATILAVLVLGLALNGCGHGQEMTVLVISIDTTRPDHLTPYGYDKNTTPTLARLAAEGALFTQARSPTSWTLPAHMSLFTGLPPAMHEVVLDQGVLHPSRQTMGEIFTSAGFRTMGFYSAPYVHEHYGFDRGMDIYERCVKPTVWDQSPARRADRQVIERLEAESHRQVSTPEVMQRGLRALKVFGRQRNFVFMHLFDPHYDFLAPRPFVKKFTDPSYAGDVDGRNIYREEIIEGNLEAADIAQLQGLYDAELAFVDSFLKGMLETLSKQGRLDSTLLIITADHGEAFYEDGRFGHRNDLREEVLRIPLIVWGPGFVHEPRVIHEAVSLYDVLPTLMDYADIDADESIWGRSLRPLIEGKSLPPRPQTASLHFVPRGDGGSNPDHLVRHEAIVFAGFKYSRRITVPWRPERPNDLSGKPIASSLVEALHDLRADPGETIDLGPVQPERLLQMRELLQAERRLQGQAAEAHFGSAAPLQPDPGMEYLDMIKALGYFAPDGGEDSPTAGEGSAAPTDDDP